MRTRSAVVPEEADRYSSTLTSAAGLPMDESSTAQYFASVDQVMTKECYHGMLSGTFQGAVT